MNVVPNGAVARAARVLNQQLSWHDKKYLYGQWGRAVSEYISLDVDMRERKLVLSPQMRKVKVWLDNNQLTAMVVAGVLQKYERSDLRKLIDVIRRSYGIDTGRTIRGTGRDVVRRHLRGRADNVGVRFSGFHRREAREGLDSHRPSAIQAQGNLPQGNRTGD